MYVMHILKSEKILLKGKIGKYTMSECIHLVATAGNQEEERVSYVM